MLIRFEENIISDETQIIHAMERLNSVYETLTLFVVDDNLKLIGTLTDGDVRRGLIQGHGVKDPVSKFMRTDFKFVNNSFSVFDFKSIRDSGVKLLPVVDDLGRITQVYNLRKMKSNLPLECLIVAGGRGERLRPLTDTVPKPMLPLGEKPIIEYGIDRLISYGVKRIYIAVRYLAEQIIDHFGDGSSKGITIEYIKEDQPLGTAGALTLIKDRVNTEYMLLMNSDIFSDIDFEDLYLTILKNNADFGAASIKHTVKVPYGIFEDDNFNIREIKEKPIYSNYANAGIYILKKELIRFIPIGAFYNITDLINRLSKEGVRMIHNPILGYWIDIGQHHDYTAAMQIVNHQRSK